LQNIVSFTGLFCKRVIRHRTFTHMEIYTLAYSPTNPHTHNLHIKNSRRDWGQVVRRHTFTHPRTHTFTYSPTNHTDNCTWKIVGVVKIKSLDTATSHTHGHTLPHTHRPTYTLTICGCVYLHVCEGAVSNDSFAKEPCKRDDILQKRPVFDDLHTDDLHTDDMHI